MPASQQPAAFGFVAQVASAYGVLSRTPGAHPESCLGGLLFYAGELDAEGSVLTIAANIAGAATLTAAADRALQKQAMRDGVVDFAVTTLDEALRILKNQLRKRETVAVSVGLAAEIIEQEMSDRGVLPNLHRHDLSALQHQLETASVDCPEEDFENTPALVAWQSNAARPHEFAQLDAIALDCLPPEAWRERRWLRLAPRYLGRVTSNMRLLAANREFAARFFERMIAESENRNIVFDLRIQAQFRGMCDEFRFNLAGS